MKHRFYLLLTLLFAIPSIAASRTLEVGPSGTYANLEAAAAQAEPGDTILFRAGIYAGGEHVSNLQGTPSAWITIMAMPAGEVVLRGGANAWQLSDAAYVRISGFVIEGQTGNGFNFDDGGTIETPAHDIILERCTFRALQATGNNDQLKLSGLDSFEVRDCSFTDGAAGGSMIDMVGCHAGTFLRNTFTRGGSNAIQAKGGSSNIRIERNTFLQAGQRALNIGGSTGLQFFRPPGINYEASNIYVYSNVFVGSDAPIAFVGAVNSEVVNNTIVTPNRWAIRILQETTEPSFLQCGDNAFRNNIVYITNQAANPTINVGPNTRPETFSFSNNLWYNSSNPSWGGPNLPVTESNGIVGQDPMLSAPPNTLTLRPGSPAIGAGAAVNMPQLDYLGRPFATPRSIGAVEGGSTTSVDEVTGARESFTIQLAGGGDRATAHFSLPDAAAGVELALYDVRGERRWMREVGGDEIGVEGEGGIGIPLGELPAGFYLCVLTSNGTSLARPVIVRK